MTTLILLIALVTWLLAGFAIGYVIAMRDQDRRINQALTDFTARAWAAAYPEDTDG